MNDTEISQIIADVLDGSTEKFEKIMEVYQKPIFLYCYHMLGNYAEAEEAYLGGARDLWEKKLFGGAYQLEGVTNSERPKYGALDLLLHPDGPSPRFGSCYFL